MQTGISLSFVGMWALMFFTAYADNIFSGTPFLEMSKLTSDFDMVMRLVFIVGFLIGLAFLMIFLIRRVHICNIKFYKSSEGIHIFWFYRGKTIYGLPNGQYLYMKPNKVKLKKRSILSWSHCWNFWELEGDAKYFEMISKGFEKYIQYRVDVGNESGARKVTLKIDDDNISQFKINGKCYEYQKINSKEFSVELPAAAKEAFERHNIEIPSFVSFGVCR